MLTRDDKRSFHGKGVPAFVVFSHPNHELAILGLLQRLRPRIVYLTDGGGRKRVSETEEGLASIGLLNQATFLNYAEYTFYDSLLACDYMFFKNISDQVGALLDCYRPAQILCDAVEFYNPIHDLTFAIVRGALQSKDETPVFEVPLAYQKSMRPGDYEIQRLPASRRKDQIETQLTEDELDNKLKARDHIYTSLLNQMGPLISKLSRDHLGLEVVAPAIPSLPKLSGDRILRYEWRAELLRSLGKIQNAITYSQHYAPMASALLNAKGTLSASTAIMSSSASGFGSTIAPPSESR